jgi:hypothetical protein
MANENRSYDAMALAAVARNSNKIIERSRITRGKDHSRSNRTQIGIREMSSCRAKADEEQLATI